MGERESLLPWGGARRPAYATLRTHAYHIIRSITPPSACIRSGSLTGATQEGLRPQSSRFVGLDGLGIAFPPTPYARPGRLTIHPPTDHLAFPYCRMRRDSLEREFAAMLANLSQQDAGG